MVSAGNPTRAVHHSAGNSEPTEEPAAVIIVIVIVIVVIAEQPEDRVPGISSSLPYILGYVPEAFGDVVNHVAGILKEFVERVLGIVSKVVRCLL